MDKNYRIGLDIGIGSVGWAVLENDIETEEPIRILDLGVRTFNVNEVPKTGESTAKSRREKRGLHRRTRRKAFRVERAKKLINASLGVDSDSVLQKLNNIDVYELRARAIDEEISNEELARVILHIYKRRGFKSNRKNLAVGGEEGKLKKAIGENVELIQRKGYRTIGEAIYKDETRFKDVVCGKTIYNVRNHSGDYRNCFQREDLVNELNIILNKQKEYNKLITDDFIKNVVEIFERQRNFDEGPGEQSPYKADFAVGNCTFIKTEKRAPKASYTFELFSGLSKINNLRIGDEKLSIEQSNILYEYIKEKESLTFERVRKLLNVPEDKLFNLCRYQLRAKKDEEELTGAEVIAKCEKATFVTMKNSYAIKKALGLESSYDNADLIDDIALMLSMYKSDARIEQYISSSEQLQNLSDAQKQAVSSLTFDKFGSLSVKAMKLVIPFLMQGHRYDEACKLAGYNHSSFEQEKQKYLKGDVVDEALSDVTSNVVKRSVNQTLRIVNEIIKKYGSPQFVTIELARDMSRNRQQRNDVEKRQKVNEDENARTREILEKEYGNSNPSRLDVLIYRLYNEQNCRCMYSGGEIESCRLFEPNYLQIDHVMPFSKSLNDSYNNKVLVIADENQNKGNRTPYEFFGDNEAKWNNYVQRVQLIKNKEKQRLLLKKHITEEDQKEFISRNLNDTRYMSKFLRELFDKYLLMTPSKKYDKQIRSVNGAVTNYLRKCWGINKYREDGDIHHAIDACVIATAEEKQIQRISTFNKFKENFKQDEKNDVFINRVTGEVMTLEQKEEYENQKIELLKEKLPLPYDEFKKELIIRSGAKYTTQTFDENDKKGLYELGYDYDEIEKVKPIFVSRMKTVKTTGAIHKETMMSAREYASTKMLIKSASLSELKVVLKAEQTKLKDDMYPEYSIENYYRPQDDRLLYLKLKNYLVENGKIPENMKVYKPRKDGSDGPVVKKVKVYEKAGLCVITPNGAASNDKMHRIDLFKRNGKYYVCPVYMSDVYAKKLPNKVVAITGYWVEIDDSFEFQFSLYQNDLIKIKKKKPLVMKKTFKNDKSTKSETIESEEIMGYYNGLDISTAAIGIKSHDNCYEVRGVGILNLIQIEKYYVDIMGKIYKAPKEERKGF